MHRRSFTADKVIGPLCLWNMACSHRLRPLVGLSHSTVLLWRIGPVTIKHQSEGSTRLACVVPSTTRPLTAHHRPSPHLFFFSPGLVQFWVISPHLGTNASFFDTCEVFIVIHVTRMVPRVPPLVSLSGANEQPCRLVAIILYSLCRGI